MPEDELAKRRAAKAKSYAEAWLADPLNRQRFYGMYPEPRDRATHFLGIWLEYFEYTEQMTPPWWLMMLKIDNTLREDRKLRTNEPPGH
jgi:hypothetical protein